MAAAPAIVGAAQAESLILAKYASLKAEQLARIDFRGNLLYVTLGVVGGLCAYALGKLAL